MIKSMASSGVDLTIRDVVAVLVDPLTRGVLHLIPRGARPELFACGLRGEDSTQQLERVGIPSRARRGPHLPAGRGTSTADDRAHQH